jgi:hypothetical protein
MSPNGCIGQIERRPASFDQSPFRFYIPATALIFGAKAQSLPST